MNNCLLCLKNDRYDSLLLCEECVLSITNINSDKDTKEFILSKFDKLGKDGVEKYIDSNLLNELVDEINLVIKHKNNSTVS